MAEFCRSCYKKVLKENTTGKALVMSKDLELCEGCGAYRHVVVCLRRSPLDSLLNFLITKRVRF